MQTIESNSHVILVAFHLDGSTAEESISSEDAQNAIFLALEYARVTAPVSLPLGWEASWWIAEDDRIDGSDNASAEFVK